MSSANALCLSTATCPVQELQQAAEYGIGLLDKNEELQLQLAALQIQHEAEVEALAAERDTVKRHHDHALLEVESWKRRFTRIEEDKSVLVADFERFAAHCTCRAATGGSSAGDRVAELTHRVAELELALQQMEAAEHASAVTIAQLRAWKRAMEDEQQATHAMERAEAQRERAFADKVAVEHVKLQKRVEQLTAANDELRAFVDAQTEELRAKKRSTQELLDDLAELRLECSAKTEQLLTAEARGSRLQRELALLEDVSYLARAVIDRDAEDDDSDDSEDADSSSSGDPQHERKPRSNSNSSSSSHRRSVVRESLSAADAREGLMPSPFTAFPASVRAANGKPVAVTPSDLESHKKLHHYFHLTAQSIIHENKLHDKCFRSSSRFTLDSWYREIIASDVPYLEWHAWLINRISHVAASVADDSDASAMTPDATRHPRPFGGFFLRRDTESSRSSSPVSTPAAVAAAETSPSHRPRLVPFSVARAFFRLLRGRQTRETSTDSSSEE